MKKYRIPIICRECGHKFTKVISPRTYRVECPKCGSYDTEIDYYIIKRRNPLTKTEKEQIKKLANVQYDISRRYSYDPVKSSFYHGRSVGMGKIAKVYNPQAIYHGSCKKNDIFDDATEMAHAVAKSSKIDSSKFIAYCGTKHIGKGYAYGFHKNLLWSYNPKSDTHYFYLTDSYVKNPLIEGAITGLGFGAGLAFSGLAVKRMLGGNVKNPRKLGPRHFDRQLYPYWSAQTRKGEAIILARDLRRKGYKVRIVKISTGYVVYARLEKENPRGGNMRNPHIIGWGDTKKDCTNHLKKHPEHRREGYRVSKLGNALVVAK